MIKLGIIGGGNMGMAIGKGAAHCGAVLPSEILVYDPNPEKIAAFLAAGFLAAANEAEVFETSQMVLLAILPQKMGEVLAKGAAVPRPKGQILLSIAAGITSAFIRSRMGGEAKAVIIMPNTPLRIGQGSTALAKTENVSEAEFAQVVAIFSSMGEVAVVGENQMIDVVPIGGSAPAFAYYLMNCLVKAVEKRGINSAMASRLVAKSFVGAGEMALQSGKPFDELVEQVCSPGGMTMEAMNTLDEKNLAALVEEACDRCIDRGYELAK